MMSKIGTFLKGNGNEAGIVHKRLSLSSDFLYRITKRLPAGRTFVTSKPFLPTLCDDLHINLSVSRTIEFAKEDPLPGPEKELSGLDEDGF